MYHLASIYGQDYLVRKKFEKYVFGDFCQFFINIYTLQTCDHSDNVNCINNGTTTQRTTTTTVAVEEESREVIYLPNGCPEDFDVYLLLPHETICNKFYYCVHGEKVERECAPGTLFNPAIMVCFIYF